MWRLPTLLLSLAAYVTAVCPPTDLRVEYEGSPMGIDRATPRFSFTLCSVVRGAVQASYQIAVTGEDGKAVWDSGLVKSPKTTNIVYAGATNLVADTVYSWQVKWGDDHGVVSEYSAPASFQTGLFASSDWKGATWIAHSNTTAAHHLLRTNFKVPAGKTVARATAFVVGLGYYKLYVDSSKVSTHELGAFTTFEERVLYDTHDCTAALEPNTDAHTLGVELGPGFYAQSSVHVGTPVLLLRLALHFTDGSVMDIVSDLKSGWESATGPVIFADIYNGETYDARAEVPGFQTSTNVLVPAATTWTPCVAGHPPSDHVIVSSHAVLPAIGARQSYSPCDMWQSSPGVYVFDFCQNMAGFVTLSVPEGQGGIATKGQSIVLRHAEAIFSEHGAINHHYGKTAEIITYILRGDGAAVEYTPLFTYMGFRYVEVTGYPGIPDFSTVKASFLNTLYELIGDVSFSDPNLNGVQHITRTAAMSNFQSIPTDCPQRERRGWLGDAQLSSETNMYNFDMAGPYTNFLALINDAQDKTTGSVQDCVPWYGHGHEPADPAWGSAFTFLANLVATYYDDDQVFHEHYAGIKNHLDSLVNITDNNLLKFSWWGDWCPPSGCHMSGKHVNSALVSTFEYILQLRQVSRYAAILGKHEDAAMYATLANKSSAAFVDAFFDADKNIFSDPTATSQELTLQTAISLASTLGLVPDAHKEQVFQNLVDDVKAKNGHLDVGIVGVKELLPALTVGGRVDVALQVAQNPEEPGWVYMVLQGATTLWETWTGSRYKPDQSWNHIMFGSQSAWYFSDLAGLRLAEGSRGWQNLTFAPQVWASAAQPPVSICSQLSSVEASTKTIRGLAAASWACPSLNSSAHLFVYNTTVPTGSTATVVLPMFGHSGVTITEGSAVVWSNGAPSAQLPVGVLGGRLSQDAAGGPVVELTVGSGTFVWQVLSA